MSIQVSVPVEVSVPVAVLLVPVVVDIAVTAELTLLLDMVVETRGLWNLEYSLESVCSSQHILTNQGIFMVFPRYIDHGAFGVDLSCVIDSGGRA